MGRWITTALLCATSMLGAAMIASQGFRPDPLPAAQQPACDDSPDDYEREDCLRLSN